jgi:geranylgeranyl transferase type-1 subunit beta
MRETTYRDRTELKIDSHHRRRRGEGGCGAQPGGAFGERKVWSYKVARPLVLFLDLSRHAYIHAEVAIMRPIVEQKERRETSLHRSHQPTTDTNTDTGRMATAMELDAARHVRYFQSCYNKVLPHHYTPNESNRLALGYLIVAALDLLSSPSSPADTPPSLIPAADRRRVRAWVLALQHGSGGFCGSPNLMLPAHFRRGYDGEQTIETAADPESANIAATFFALILLGLLADGSDESAREMYRHIDREATLRWLRRLQRPDGSFGEVLKADGTIAGGRDMRYCYMASTIRWILRGNDGDGSLDFDVDKFVAHIRQSQSFDGGIAESYMGESHAGYAYCAVAALSILDLAAEDDGRPNRYLEAGIPNITALVHWLVSRQFTWTAECEDEYDDSDDEDEDAPTTKNTTAEVPVEDMAAITLEDSKLTGFNGRLNKIADTCYAWWVAGSLQMLSGVLGGAVPVDRASGRAFLLEKMQHIIGGFSKHTGKPPDVYHSYLGLAALSTMAGDDCEAGLGKFDARLTIGQEAAGRVSRGRAALKI